MQTRETPYNSINEYEEIDMEDIGVNTGGIRERKMREAMKKKTKTKNRKLPVEPVVPVSHPIGIGHSGKRMLRPYAPTGTKNSEDDDDERAILFVDIIYLS